MREKLLWPFIVRRYWNPHRSTISSRESVKYLYTYRTVIIISFLSSDPLSILFSNTIHFS